MEFSLKRVEWLPTFGWEVQKDRHQGFYPLGTPVSFICWSGGNLRTATAPKRGTAVGLPWRIFLRLFAVHRQRTATQAVYSTQARHDSAAQLFNTLYRTAPTN